MELFLTALLIICRLQPTFVTELYILTSFSASNTPFPQSYISSNHWLITVEGQTTRHGPNVSFSFCLVVFSAERYEIALKVFPKPISSAKIDPLF
jgi:hypothetical protein